MERSFPLLHTTTGVSTPGVVGVAVALHVTPQLHHQTVVELAGGIAKLSVPSPVWCYGSPQKAAKGVPRFSGPASNGCNLFITTRVIR